jgi:hypothetical protein
LKFVHFNDISVQCGQVKHIAGFANVFFNYKLDLVLFDAGK